ncbi:MAG: hypothetical protein ABIF10_04170 [Candidatus Woesearchaeota archaeon]
MSESFKRQVAYKLRIADLLRGEYVRRDGLQPNVLVLDKQEVSRVNVIATVVASEEDVAILDDGTARISVRSVLPFVVGDIVLVIARLREFDNERYLFPEIVRKVVDPKWIELRSLELRAAKEDKGSNREDVCSVIRRLDSGDGAEYQMVVEALGSGSESAIESLLRQGEIFEVRPGRLKVLD